MRACIAGPHAAYFERKIAFDSSNQAALRDRHQRGNNKDSIAEDEHALTFAAALNSSYAKAERLKRFPGAGRELGECS
jgi:hypothetical protein